MPYSGSGSGTLSDPYIITNVYQLQEIDNYRSAHFKLANDIDATVTRTWNKGTGAYSSYYYGFLPIEYFSGTLNGNNKKIINLYINRTPTNGATRNMLVGLFCNVSGYDGTQFYDLILENVDITGGRAVGGLAGWMMRGDVVNVHVTGKITSTYQDVPGYEFGVGGLIGSTEASAARKHTIRNCSSSVEISASTNLTSLQVFGGLIGYLMNGASVENCYSSAKINLNFSTNDEVKVGGLIGYNYNTPVSYSYSSCEITVNCPGATHIRAGGFIGHNNNYITLCFSSGTLDVLSSGAARVGGFIGYNTGAPAKCGSSVNVNNYSQNATTNQTGGFIGYSAGSASNCYARGSVNIKSGIGHSNAYIGGFVGYKSSGTYSCCYSTGAVYAVGNPTNGGGFAGYDSGTMTACFWDKETSGWTTTKGTAVGKTTQEMKTESTFTSAGWDFTSVWRLPSYTRSPGIPNALWFSKSDDYDNFDIGTQDDDAIQINIPTTNPILWIDSLESVLVGTSGDEWSVSSNKLGTPITPSNVGCKLQSNYGSSNIQPVQTNEVLLFVDYAARKIRELTMGNYEGKYVANDMTVLAEHITYPGVICIAHQKNPESILWCVLSDGSLVGMVYDREQNVVAWFKCPISGTVLSVCVIPSAGEDEVWIDIKRTINGQTKIYVEKINAWEFAEQSDAYFVDCGITAEFGTPQAVVAGLDHLEGETVQIVADGAVEAEQTVSGGQIVLSRTASKVHVGLPYSYLLQPMRLVPPYSEGSSISAVKRLVGLSVSFYKTLLAKYGTDADNLQSIDWRSTEDYDSPPSLFTGDKTVVLESRYNPETPLYIGGSEPMPCTVRALVVKTDVTG